MGSLISFWKVGKLVIKESRKEGQRREGGWRYSRGWSECMSVPPSSLFVLFILSLMLQRMAILKSPNVQMTYSNYPCLGLKH